MASKRIFITGASGCIGHYVAESLIQETDHELFFLVRNPDKIGFDYEARPGITLIEGDLRELHYFKDFLQSIEVAILIATSWGGMAEVYDVNVVKNLELMRSLNPEVCEQVIYFSTASILDRNNQVLRQAGQIGTDYIRSKHDCFIQLPRLEIAPKITTVFPTLVFGGEEKNKPASHLTSGLPDVSRWAKLIRWFKTDGSFHFIHGRDIALVVKHLVENPPVYEKLPRNQLSEEQLIVLGNPPITVDEAVEEISAYLGNRIYFRIPLSKWLADFFIKVFDIKMAAWDRFCLDYRHFTYKNVVNPARFGIEPYCSTLSQVLKLSGIRRKD
ncbi:MAG: NAD-dependent epimerase/dehydratase family protein [Halothece sp.]